MAQSKEEKRKTALKMREGDVKKYRKLIDKTKDESSKTMWERLLKIAEKEIDILKSKLES